MSTKKLIGIGAAVLGVIAVIALAATFLFFIPNSVANQGNKMEQEISRAYTSGQISLSTCTNKTVAAANVAGAQKDALTEVYRAAVGGRYGDGAQLNRTQLFSALQEAYPNLDGLNKTFDKALAIMVGCQGDFSAQQNEVTNRVTEFNTWRTGSWTTRTFGGDFPNDNLQVNVQGLPHETGRAALDRMSLPIVDTTSSSAYQSGTTTTTNPFDRQPAPTTAPR